MTTLQRHYEFSASKSFFNRAKADSKASWLFQLEKSGDEILAHFHRQILAGVGIKTSLVGQGFKIGPPDGKQIAAFYLFLRLAGFTDFHCHFLVLGFVSKRSIISFLWAKEASNTRATSLQRRKRK
jgi:hypothetical protein